MNRLSYLARAEIRMILRNGLAGGLAVTFLLLLLLATWLSVQRTDSLAAEHETAAVADHEIWVGQGEDNPHAAAHFSRYAFKPVPSLALFDPGVLDTAGAAIWMQGHYQDPAQIRRIEDAPLGAIVTQMSPAFLLMTFGSLVIIVFLSGTVAGEREDGTLAQLLVTGLGPGKLAAGKMLGALAITTLLMIAAIFIMTITGLSKPGIAEGSVALFRLSGLILVYGLFFLMVAGVALGVSAHFATRRSALGVLLGLWAAVFIACPYIAAETALGVAPNPDGPSTYRRIVNASNAYFSDDVARQKALEEALSEYGVETKADLPFRYDGYELQYSEELAHPKFEAIYAEVRDRYERQEKTLKLFSIALPNLAVEMLSAGLSGTDRLHHQSFTDAAEMHRQLIVKQLNHDLAFGGDPESGEAYVAGLELWETIPDFRMEAPQLTAFIFHYLPSLGLLLLQTVLALWFAYASILASTRRVRA